MSKQSKAYAVHLANEPSELCFQARAQFLEYIARLKPQVIADLWDSVFPEFRWAVIRRFPKEVFEGISDLDAYFKEKQKKYFEDPDSNYVHLLHRRLEQATGAPPYRAMAQLRNQPELQVKVNEVVQRYCAAVHNALVAELIQSKLITEPGVDAIKTSFRSYAQIAERKEDQLLVNSIHKWSETWNLNAAWCRDHAVAVLREWLSHRQLRSVGLYTSEEAMQRTGWSSAARELLFDSIMSRLSADSAVYGLRGPKPLTFRLGNDEFEREGFNRLTESQATYKRKSLADFELWVMERRRPKVVRILHAGEDENDLTIEPLFEIVRRFTKALNHHIRATLKATNKTVGKLIRVKRKRSLANHVKWAVEYQVAPERTLAEIVEIENCAEAVAGVLRDSACKTVARDKICEEFCCYQSWTENDVDRGLALLLERGIVYTEHEDSTWRVIDALKAEGRDDLFGPDRSIEVQREAENVIRERLEVDYEKTRGIVIVRYGLVAGKEAHAPDRSTVSRAVNDILSLIDLGSGVRSRGRSKGDSGQALSKTAGQ